MTGRFSDPQPSPGNWGHLQTGWRRLLPTYGTGRLRPGDRGVHWTDSEPPAPPSEGRGQGVHLCSWIRLARGPGPLWAEAGSRAPNASGESQFPGGCVCGRSGGRAVTEGGAQWPLLASLTVPTHHAHPGVLPHWAQPGQLSCEERNKSQWCPGTPTGSGQGSRFLSNPQHPWSRPLSEP